MQPLRDRSIQQKITIVTMLICSVVLLLACAVLFVLQARSIKQQFTHELEATSRIIAYNSGGAVAAKDKKAAAKILAGLQTMAQISNAHLVLNDGRRLAHFGTEADEAQIEGANLRKGYAVQGTRVLLAQSVMYEGKRVGTLYLAADCRVISAQLLKLYGLILILVLAASLLLAFLLSRTLQRFITGPILQLAVTAQTIAQNKDYAVRAEKNGGREMGLLTDAFNQMLAQIQSQDGALQGAQRELREQVAALEWEIAEREKAEAAQDRLTAILEATPDIVCNADPRGMVLYLNRAGREMLDLGEDEDLSQKKLLDFHPEAAARLIAEEGMPAAVEKGSWSAETAIINRIGQEINVSQVLIAHKNPDGEVCYFSTVMRDMAERRRVDEALRVSQQRLVETSRLAGMAEVATGVLHNVGNVLNSVNVSASLVVEKLRRSRVAKLSKAAALLTGRNGDLADYLTHDENGKKLPGYLARLGEFLVEENAELLQEVDQLGRNIEHIKEVVAMQQSYARVSGAIEDLPVERLVEDAIAMNTGAFERHGVVVQKRFSEVPLVRVDRHKVLQILINLIRNAKYALDDVERLDKRITISISAADADQVCVVVADNGIGISPENLTRIFAHGFTTRPDGHGFGLHSGALAARSMGGSLSVVSLGVRRGATFTLKLPVAPPNTLRS